MSNAGYYSLVFFLLISQTLMMDTDVLEKRAASFFKSFVVSKSQKSIIHVVNSHRESVQT